MPIVDVTADPHVLILTFKELRHMIRGIVMTNGMDASYARLEREVLAA